MKRILSLCLTAAGFGLTFVFNIFDYPVTPPCTDDKLCSHYIIFRPDLFFDTYSYVFFLGERIFVALIYLQVWMFDRGLSSLCCFILFSLYILDYMLFFNDRIPGTSISFAMFMGGCFLIMILREFYLLLHGNSRHI